MCNTTHGNKCRFNSNKGHMRSWRLFICNYCRSVSDSFSIIQVLGDTHTHIKSTVSVQMDYLVPNFFLSFCFLRTTSRLRSFHELFLSLMGLLPTYLPKDKDKWMCLEHDDHKIIIHVDTVSYQNWANFPNSG